MSVRVALSTDSHPYANNRVGVAPSIWQAFLDDNDDIEEGEISQSSSYNGTIDKIEKGEIDLGVGPYSVTVDRQNRVEYSRPFSIADVAIFYNKEESRNVKSLIIILSVLSIIFAIFTIISMSISGYSLFIAIYNSFSSFLRSGTLLKEPTSISHYLINMIWMLIAFFFLAGSVSYITSFIVSAQTPIKGRYGFKGAKIAYIEGTYFNQLINQIDGEAIPVADMIEGLSKLSDKEVDGYMDDRDITMFYTRDRNYNFEISKTIRADEYCFVMQKNSPLKELLDRYIVTYRENDRTKELCNEAMGYTKPLCYL